MTSGIDREDNSQQMGTSDFDKSSGLKFNVIKTQYITLLKIHIKYRICTNLNFLLYIFIYNRFFIGAILIMSKFYYQRISFLLATAALGFTLSMQSATAFADDCLLDSNNNGVADGLDDDRAADSGGSDFRLACGAQAIASGAFSSSLGASSAATNDEASAIGYLSLASGQYATAIGAKSAATQVGASAIGELAVANSQYATAVGNLALASADFASAFGPGAQASGQGGACFRCCFKRN